MTLSTAHFERCIETLNSSVRLLLAQAPESIEYEVYRNAVIKGFELTLERAGKLLRKALKQYEATPKAVDALVYKDVLRLAGTHGLLKTEEIERWFAYRDNRNNTAHDYGVGFSENTLALMPNCVADAQRLAIILRDKFYAI